MKLGILSAEICAKSVSDLFSKSKKYGFSMMQFVFSSVCDEEVPAHINDDLLDKIRANANKNGIEIAAVNGTFNMAHPSREERISGVTRFENVAKACKKLNCNLITICTGSRNTESMWAHHPQNGSEEAWADMSETMQMLLDIAQNYDLILAMEVEASNIIDSPQKAVKIIEEMGSERLKIIMDCANLFGFGKAKKEMVEPTIIEAFNLLGKHIVLAHGKDVLEGEDLNFVGAGMGIVDFELFCAKLTEIGYTGGMILHGTKNELQVEPCVRFLKNVFT